MLLVLYIFTAVTSYLFFYYKNNFPDKDTAVFSYLLKKFHYLFLVTFFIFFINLTAVFSYLFYQSYICFPVIFYQSYSCFLVPFLSILRPFSRTFLINPTAVFSYLFSKWYRCFLVSFLWILLPFSLNLLCAFYSRFIVYLFLNYTWVLSIIFKIINKFYITFLEHLIAFSFSFSIPIHCSFFLFSYI